MRIAAATLAACLAVSISPVTAPLGTPSDPIIKVIPVASPAAGDSAQPQLTALHGAAILSWIEREGTRATLKFSERIPTGWSPARAVASGDNWFVNWADVPSVVRLADGTLAAHWLEKNGGGSSAYDVRLSFSRDGGAAWTPATTPHSDGTKTEHGFVSLFQLPGAGLGLVFLDGRAMTEGHGGHGTGDMSIRFAAYDRTGKQTAEQPIDLRVCECCPTSAVVTADGPIAAFRNRSEDETRDIHVSRLENGKWTESLPVHRDGWKIPGCPVNGPMLSARGRDVAIAWFTVKEEQGHSYVAFSRDAGRSFGPPVRLDDAMAIGRVDVELLPGGAAVATWIELSEGRAEFRARRVEQDGRRSAPLTIAAIDSGRASGYPRVAYQNGELVFAWTERAGSSGVQTAVARVH